MSEEPAPEPPSRALIAFTPVPREKDRTNGWKPEVQLAFIEALADSGSVKAACRAVGRADHGAYQLRRHPQGAEFAAAWDAALAHGIRRIEDVAMDRALNGVEVPVYSYGKLVGTRIVYNDRLLMFMLRNRAPERFAAGGPRALNAVDALKLERLKKQWRQEWEAEKRAEAPAPAEIRAGIERRMEALRRRIEASASPAAYAAQIAAVAQRRADEAAGWRPGEPYEPHAARAAELLPGCIEEVRREWPEQERLAWTEQEEAEWGPLDQADEGEDQAAEEPEPQAGARTRTLKDAGW